MGEDHTDQTAGTGICDLESSSIWPGSDLLCMAEVGPSHCFASHKSGHSSFKSRQASPKLSSSKGVSP